MAEQEQTAVVDAPQTEEVAPEQTEESAVTEDLVAAEETVSEPAEFDYGQIDEDWVRNASEKSEAVRRAIEQAKNDGFNAGKQRRDKELRLERGSEETAKAWQQRLAEKYGIELDDEDKRTAPLWVRANRDVERVNVARSIVDSYADAFDEAESERISAVVDAIADDPEQMEGLAAQLREVALTRLTSKHIGDLTLEEVPENSKLWKSTRDYIEAEVTKELEARSKEQEGTPVNPPRTSAGNPPSGGSLIERVNAIPAGKERTSYIETLSDKERDELWAASVAG